MKNEEIITIYKLQTNKNQVITEINIYNEENTNFIKMFNDKKEETYLAVINKNFLLKEIKENKKFEDFIFLNSVLFKNDYKQKTIKNNKNCLIF